MILLALSLARARVATGAGYLMALGGLIALPLFFVTVAPIVVAVPALLALIGVGWIGVRLLTQQDAVG